MKFAVVAPVVKTPPHDGRQLEQVEEPRHRNPLQPGAERRADRENAFWSSVDASQSAPSAAGVTPPVTKWKKRGPDEPVAASTPFSTSSVSAASAPSPCSGSPPPKRSAAGPAPGESTGAPSSPARYPFAVRSTYASTASVSSGRRSGSVTLAIVLH